MASMSVDYTQYTPSFILIADKLLALTNKKVVNKKLINSNLHDLNELDYRYVTVVNQDAVLLLINELCTLALPNETALIQNTCKLLVNLCQSNVKLQAWTCVTCQRWIVQTIQFSQPLVHKDVLLALQSFLIMGQFDDINYHLDCLIGKEGFLWKYLDLSTQQLELVCYAIGCLEAILTNKLNGPSIQEDFVHLIKDLVLNIVFSGLCAKDDHLHYSKVISLCLRVLHILTLNKLILNSTDYTGKILGVVQACLYHGIKDYPPVNPELLRPAAMNLPERVHVVPKCKNLKNHRAKPKKQPAMGEYILINIYSSDSAVLESDNSKVRLEAIRLLQALIANSQSRDIFGYWPQIVATGSRNNARVLARSILMEPVPTVKQNVLSTLTDLLVGAKPFLMHAEDAHHMSFITFFGTVSLMVRELHLTLSLTLNTEKNVAVLTHALKCTAALIQGTPYARLQPGLLTKLTTRCRLHIFHKDITVRAAALSTFEAVASCEPITPEIFGILAEESFAATELKKVHLNSTSKSDLGTEDDEDEEIDVEDLSHNSTNFLDQSKVSKAKNISLLIQVCLENISNKTRSTSVRVQSLKLLGRMAFNTGSLVFSHLEVVTAALIGVTQETELQVVLHACRVLEIIAGCLSRGDSNDTNGSLFWNIIFEPMTLLAQHPQITLREAACDCLGSIGATTFSQLPRQRTVLIITVLFGAVRDEESAVRAAGLRALGMLVTLPPLEEETGFLMDLADIVCLAADDSNHGVRVKNAWALANLCDCLSRKKNHEDSEPLPINDLLPKLYHVSVQASKGSSKVKCNAIRAVGSILSLCAEKRILDDTTLGLDTLLGCAMLGNDMKVRWNACRALGLVLSHNPDDILPSAWRGQVFPVLCSLICDSPNFKVRTNAAWALYSCNSFGTYTIILWKSIILAFENSQHVPSYAEYPHRDALVQQLCLTLSHVAACTKVTELQSLWAEIGDHIEDISNYLKEFQETTVPEKIGDLIKAKSAFGNYVKTAASFEERQIAQSLANIFERTIRYDNLDVITTTV